MWTQWCMVVWCVRWSTWLDDLSLVGWGGFQCGNISVKGQGDVVCLRNPLHDISQGDSATWQVIPMIWKSFLNKFLVKGGHWVGTRDLLKMIYELNLIIKWGKLIFSFIKDIKNTCKFKISYKMVYHDPLEKNIQLWGKSIYFLFKWKTYFIVMNFFNAIEHFDLFHDA